MQYNWSVAIKYWLGVVQQEHVRRAVAMGFAQANHGSRAALERMGEADGLVYYSPKTDIDGEPLKEFTAIGRIADAAVFQTGESPGQFRPWRRLVNYDTDAVPRGNAQWPRRKEATSKGTEICVR